MADIILDVQSVPVTPAAGQAALYVDQVVKRVRMINDVGFVRGEVNNFSIAAQTPAAATLTYLIGSSLPVPTSQLQVGTCFRWTFDITKTAAGIAASIYAIVVGTAGTTADTARVSFIKPAGTAVIDNGRIQIGAVCRGPISASGVMAGRFELTHNLTATGHAIIPCVNLTTVSAAFDMTIPNLVVGLVCTTGAADAITTQLMTAEAWNL